LGGATAGDTLFRAQKSDFWNERSLANSVKQGQQRTSALQNSLHFGISSAFEVPSLVQKCWSWDGSFPLDPSAQRCFTAG
jgi:hypothetical protein